MVICKEEGALRAVGTRGGGDGGHSGQRGLLGGLKKDGGSHVDVGWDTQAKGPSSPWGAGDTARRVGRGEHLGGGLCGLEATGNLALSLEGASLVDTWWPQTTSPEFGGVGRMKPENRCRILFMPRTWDTGAREIQ